MMMNGFDLSLLKNDLIENPTARCACALVLDTSGSMSGAPIDDLNVWARRPHVPLRRDLL
jgi:hypothetical protein